MDTPIVTATDTASTYYTDLATVLRDVADRLATLNADTLAPLIVGLTLQPAHDDEAVEVATIDAIAEALGTVGHPVQMSSGAWHHHAERTWEGPRMRVAAFCGITAPDERATREEAERLRAEVEQLRAERDDFRSAAKMYASTVDDLRRQIDPMRAELDGRARVAAAALTPDAEAVP